MTIVWNNRYIESYGRNTGIGKTLATSPDSKHVIKKIK